MPIAAAGEARVLTGLLDTVYISLHTGDPGTTGANEVTGGSYARESAAFSQASSNPTTASNSGAVQFTQATGAWGTVTHFGIWSAASSGDYLGGAAVDVSKAIVLGDIARWEIGGLAVTAD